MSRSKLFAVAIGAVVVSALGAAALKSPPPEPNKPAATTEAPAPEPVPDSYYTCPMDPYVKQQEPGKCPSCGMKLVKKPASASDKKKARTKGTLELSHARQQLIGVRTTRAEERELIKTLVASGALAADETKIVELQSDVSGTVDQLLGNPVGQQVRRGEPLFSIALPDGKKHLIRANATGHISWRIGFANTQVTPKLRVANIYDHSNIWVWVEVYETDISLLKLNQSASITVPAYPGKTFTGRVTQIAPLLQPDTHTMKVRIEVANTEYLLKPGMSAIVEVHASLGNKLAVPEAAVIRTGTENVVFVALGEGRFEVRDVKLGAQVAGHYEVLEGLEDGDELVSAANFLVDAESKLQGIRTSWER